MKIKVLVVDDSALTRKILEKIISSDPDLEVIDFAENGLEAIEKARKLKPDVITLDVLMPKLDGLKTLETLVKEKICPVIILSVITQEGALETIKALQIGAFDVIPKPKGGGPFTVESISSILIKKIKEAYLYSKDKNVLNKLSKEIDIKEKQKLSLEPSSRDKIDFYGVVIGISTGGPKTIYDVLPKLPADLNASIFLIQHMPSGFTKQYAERLDKYSELKVVEAEDGMEVKPGYVYVGKAGYHLKIRQGGKNTLKIWLSKFPEHLFKPSVDITMENVLQFFKEKTIGVLMTGMGDDGAEGMVKIKNTGGLTIAESGETAIVFGMPAEAIKRGGANVILPSYKIADKIIEIVNNNK